MVSMYQDKSKEELKALKKELLQAYDGVKAEKLALNMARGKPSIDQINLSLGMLDEIGSSSNVSEDYLSYGLLDGIPEAKELMASLMEVDPELVFLGGNSSLNLMHDIYSFGFTQGFPESEKPWCQEEEIKFICPSPGYDRHFSISEHFGTTLVPVDLTEDGPDMDAVEELIKDPSVKGIWCVPKYSNPTGTSYNDDTIRRLAALSPAAKDFKIFYDNAYTIHHLDMDDQDVLLNIQEELAKTGNENMVITFLSTSKLTFPGGGISAVSSGKEMMKWLNHHMSFQTIGYDKINMLRQVRFLKNKDNVMKHMAKHASVLAPRFRIVLDTLEELEGLGIAQWTRPKGGYFISLDVMEGCAKRVVQLCSEAGVLLTPAGATFPYGKDPKDQNIRIAPSFPPEDELQQAASLLVLCTKLAAVEKLLV